MAMLFRNRRHSISEDREGNLMVLTSVYFGDIALQVERVSVTQGNEDDAEKGECIEDKSCSA